ncbi:MAG: ABC transporter substrate-binding protein [Pseudomonadota bacterium]
MTITTKRLLGVSIGALMATTAVAQDSELLIFDWSGFEEDGYWQVYAEEYGEPPSYTFFGEEEEAFQKLRSGFRADLAHPCSQSVDKWRQAGLIEPWDISKIPNYASVAEQFRSDPVFVDGEDVYFIPADFGTTATAYNADEITLEDVASIEVYKDPKWAGRIALPDNVDDIYALAYLAVGVQDWREATEDDFKAASDWLREVHPNVRAYWTDGSELAQLMGTGEVLIAWAWSETPATMNGEGFNIGFQREHPEGSSVWQCGYVNLVDGPGSEDKAHFFMNQWLGKPVADYIVGEWGYGHSNVEAMTQYSEEDLTAAGLGQVDVPLLAQLPMDNRLREAMIAEFEKIKAGF